jgi:hypothetical protein
MRLRTTGRIVALALIAACGSKAADDRKKSPGKPAPVPLPVPLPLDDAGLSVAPVRALVTSVEVKVVDPAQGKAIEIFPRQLAQRFGATLGHSEWFVVEQDEGGGAPPTAPGPTRPARVQLVVGYGLIAEGSEGRPAAIATVEAALMWQGGRGHSELASDVRMVAERSYFAADKRNLDGIVAEFVERAVSDAAAALIAKEAVRVGPEEGVLAAITGDDVDLRLWGLAVAGERRIEEAVPAAIDLLTSEREAERDAAIGALIALKDRRAVGPLTQLADFHDYSLMRRTIEAVAVLGGDEAKSYLEFVASGHPDDGIKAQAADALVRIGRRRK